MYHGWHNVADVHKRLDRKFYVLHAFTEKASVQKTQPKDTSDDGHILDGGPLGWLWHTTIGSGITDVQLSQERAREVC